MGTGEFDACVRLLRDLVLRKKCRRKELPWRQRCTIDGVEQPLLPAHRFQYVGVSSYYFAYVNSDSSDFYPASDSGGGDPPTAFNEELLAQRSRVNRMHFTCDRKKLDITCFKWIFIIHIFFRKIYYRIDNTVCKQEVCTQPYNTTLEQFRKGRFQMRGEGLERFVNRFCFQAAWVQAVIRDGYEVAKSKITVIL